jgi:hypothetical protein
MLTSIINHQGSHHERSLVPAFRPPAPSPHRARRLRGWQSIARRGRPSGALAHSQGTQPRRARRRCHDRHERAHAQRHRCTRPVDLACRCAEGCRSSAADFGATIDASCGGCLDCNRGSWRGRRGGRFAAVEQGVRHSAGAWSLYRPVCQWNAGLPLAARDRCRQSRRVEGQAGTREAADAC